MSHKIKIYIISMGLFLIGAMQLSVVAPNVLAAPPPRGGEATPVAAPIGNDCPKGQTAQDAQTCLKNNPVTKFINDVIAFLSAAVGVVVVGTIILGGIQYSMAGGSANATQAAKQRITNGLIALLAFIFIAAFLQWLIPGGL